MGPMWRHACLLICVLGSAVAAEKKSALQLIEIAKSNQADLRSGIEATFDAKELKDGTAWTGHGPDFFFATEAASQPTIVIDDASLPPMPPPDRCGRWYTKARSGVGGQLHSFHYLVEGKSFGGRLDLPAFGPLSYLQAGVPSGLLSEKIVHTSKIYDGMKSEYWIYVPAQYDPKLPAALMVFQDGGGYLDREGKNPALNVIDNLIAQKKI